MSPSSSEGVPRIVATPAGRGLPQPRQGPAGRLAGTSSSAPNIEGSSRFRNHCAVIDERYSGPMVVEARTRADRIYRQLRSDILTGRLSPGQRLPFAELCQHYDVSIGVLREVLPRLTEQGLVSAEPQIGFRVMSVSEA